MGRDTKTDALLMAGGRSRRMGSPKGLLEFDSKPWICHQVDRLIGCGLRRVIIVVGEHSKVYRKALADAPENILFVFNADPEAPQFVSLQLGLRALLEDAPNWVWVQPLDTIVPNLNFSTKLKAALDAAPEQLRVVRPHLDGRFGHPVLLEKRFCEKLLGVDQDDLTARLDVQIRGLPSDAIQNVDGDNESIFANFNTIEQWRSFAKGSTEI